jgi:UDP-glucose 4-epimerase
MSFTNIAIIGANGFIGKHLCEALLKYENIHLKLFGRTSAAEVNLPAPYVQLDLMNTEQIKKEFATVDLVYYLASGSIPSSSWNEPKFEVEKNLLPFINFLETTAQMNLKKLVFVSSAGTIYGPSLKKLTEDSDKKPFSPYGINKLAMENYLTYFEARFGIKHDIFRVSNVYGIGQDTAKGLGIINTFLEKILQKGEVEVFGNGEAIRNYINVIDVARLLSLSAVTNGHQSHLYNLASDDNLSINDLLSLMKKIVEEPFNVNYRESRQSDNPAILLDNSRIKSVYPNFVFTKVEEGIMQTYQSIKKNITN